jgi:aspartokinase-like uncharacterized kinase
MSLDAVIKIGGSLSRSTGLETLCREISRLGTHRNLLVVPGGGDFADRVRDAYERYHLNETAAHNMALLAMDQYGYLLNHLIDGSSLTVDLAAACNAAESGRVAILLPSMLVIQVDPLPHSWQVTSDTIAAWVSHRVYCRRLLLVKDVDGIFSAGSAINAPAEPEPELTVAQLAERSGGVDAYLSGFLASVSLETWVINGLRPERLSELLDTGYTIGTRIRPSAG